MNILGISAFYHDSACVLLSNGKLLAAAQEERFTRKKHDSSFPIHSLKFCFEKNKLSLKDIDAIAYYDKPFLTFERLLETYMSHAPKGFNSFSKAMPLWLGKKLNMRSHIKKELKKNFPFDAKNIPDIFFNYHHLSHAAAAFFPSPYEEAALLCLDGVGEWATTSAWLGCGSRIEPLWQLDFPHSLGLLYSTFTEYCGFKVNSGEYKLMGLAPYGRPKYLQQIKDHVIDIKEDGSFKLNMKYFKYEIGSTMAHPNLYDILQKKPRQELEPLSSHYADVAHSIQKVVEEVVLKLANTLQRETGCKNLCLSGGVALNCVASGLLLKEKKTELWIPPNPGDSGAALGAAYSLWHQHFKKPRVLQKPDAMRGVVLGPEYNDQEIENVLKEVGATYRKLSETELIQQVALHIKNGQVVGWFQGGMEFGPRALGQRSILGDPRSRDMQQIMNQKIKMRESFRPFALSILREKMKDYFDLDVESPYMVLVFWLKDSQRRNSDENENSKGLEKLSVIRSEIPSCTHVDYSTRVQTVNSQDSPLYYQLIQEFYRQTACPALINTSFNVRGEPIVCTPYEAYRCFMNTEMDYLSLGRFLLDKREQNHFEDNYLDSLKKD